ncbi:hypothetical protein [Halorarum halobium]|uniref:hypothetical protein n=1 Tax=Halorarum halobium TaxID=3075121 RepID=UPI0028ABCCD0|nr:hypothetical protein [Halobaculum sp. XH14]
MSSSSWFEGQLKQIVLLVAVSTVVLTADFVGLLSLLTGRATEIGTGIGGRFPAYVLVMAVAFVVTIVGLARFDTDGRTVLSAATGVGLLTLVTGALAGEGVVYAIAYPSEILSSQLLFYFVAAGLIGTGLSFWTVNYWRDFTREARTAGA